MLPKDFTAAALVGRMLRPGMGPSVIRINQDTTATDITTAFPTVSKLCDEPDPARSLRAAEGENLGEIALLVRHLMAPIDLQVVKAAGVTFPVSMIERMIEEALRGDPANTAKRQEIVGRIVPKSM